MINVKLKKNTKVVVGSIRQSQLITTFGAGSMVDFVDHTVIMSGIDDWDWADKEEFKIFNQNLQNLLGVQYFVKPKLSTKTTMWDKGSADIPASIFPTMLYCPQCKYLVSASSVTPNSKNNKFFCHAEGCPGNGHSQLVPSRFVLVCPDGHIEDFPYHWWVHNGPGEKYECTAEKPNIEMYYIRNRTDLDSLVLKCGCGAKRSMKNASGINAFADYPCTGKRPWLGDSEQCNAHAEHRYMQMRVRSESSVFFSSTVSALTIPPWSTEIAQEIQKVYSFLGPDGDNKDIIIRKVKSRFPKIQENIILDIYNKIQAGRDKKTSMREIIEDEYIALSSCSSDEKKDDFIAHIEETPSRYNHIIEKVVALDRLTVVTAMNGFKRLTAPTGYGDKTLSKITKNPNPYWLPGIEQRGEGIFIQFNQDTLDAWVHKYGVRYKDMRNKLEESYFKPEINEGRFSPQYVFLHTFAHLFIRELSHLCGYSSASMKERIYSTYNRSNRQMGGVLVYTSTADADGSLGGLVEQAKTINIEKIIASMVERGKWCSADPVCYTSKDQGNMALNYAACFACTLLPETSCEFFNILLDRCAVCGSPENADLGLMNWSK